MIEEWTKGAENVDPEDDVLGRIWQDILCDILEGNYPEKELTRILAQLNRDEAIYILGFMKHSLKEAMLLDDRMTVNAISMKKLQDLKLILRSDIILHAALYGVLSVI
ncbi:MAG: hypothetical protein JWO82_1912, partial [Akkermansiaceae bacterium]|nr:hypothetical protein [Akkermansiaceae bacterium]